MERRRRWVGAGLICVISACSPNGNPDATPPSTSLPAATTQSEGTITLETAPAVATTGTAHDQFGWYLNVLNGTAELDELSYQRRFAPVLRERLPFEQFTGLTNQLITVAPLSLASSEAVPLTELDPDTTAVQTVANIVVANSGSGFSITLGVDGNGQVAAFDIESEDDPTLMSDPSDLHETAREVGEYGDFSWLAATVDLDGTAFEQVGCTTIEGEEVDTPTGVGTASAIWVLGAVVDAIAAGEMTWDTELTITDNNKSIDPGVLDEYPDLSPIKVQNAATFMFELSDNTAYDLLIDAVGRDRVEAAQSRWGNSHADLNFPMLTTREMFVLKTSTAEVQDAYLSASPDERRDILPDLRSVSADDIPVDVFLQGPIRPDQINWFASPHDLCTGLARLMWTGKNTEGMGPVVDIITADHGTVADAHWSEVAFKGGDEPGMLTMAWLMSTESDIPDDDNPTDWYAYVGTLTNGAEDFTTAEPNLLFAAGRDLVAPDRSDTPNGINDGDAREDAE